MKKILLLGGLRYLIPVIKAAKEMGYYVITCDYVPDNIAHNYSDEYHNVSITDREAVLNLAKSLQVDGVMSFAVDPGVLTAAYVSEEMGLPSAGPLKSIEILQNKDLFRNFLEENGFNVPKSKSYTSVGRALSEFDINDLPVIVKPVDSAGSKGVSKVTDIFQLEAAILYAIRFSDSKKFIIEEFLECKGCSSDSDCFSVEGKLKVVTFSAQRFDKNSPNPFTPSAYSWPATISIANQEYLTSELQRLLTLLSMKSSIYNIEVRERLDGKAFIMEVSPRGGGNRLSEMIRYSTGVDLISNAVKASLGEHIAVSSKPQNGYWAEVILYSNIKGSFKELRISEDVNSNIKEIDLWVKVGDEINAFNAANDAVGTLVLKFETSKEMEEVISDYSTYFEVIVE